MQQIKSKLCKVTSLNTQAQGENQKMIAFIFGLAVVLLICLLLDNIHTLKEQKEQISELTKWHKIALTDDLTQISNRVAYSNRIQELKNTKSSNANIAIMLFDIDDFKQINDTCGHLEGDRVLKQCAKMLDEVFSYSGCIVYRIGGDEFAVISVGASEERIISALLEIRKRENIMGFRVSKGYALFDGKEEFSKVFRRADEMLYADKKSKKY